MKPLFVYSDTQRFAWLFPALIQFSSNQGLKISVGSIDDALNIKNSTVLIDGEVLTPEGIETIKNNGNMLCVFDENDGACFYNKWAASDKATMVDLVFKQSGIQRFPTAWKLKINEDLTYESIQFPFPGWNLFETFKKDNKIISLPHIPWGGGTEGSDFLPYEDKRKTCLIRGSLHFYRYHMFLNLVKYRKADRNSSFMMKDYHHPQMADRFRFCDWCINFYHMHNGIRYSDYKDLHPKNCCVCDTNQWQEGMIQQNHTWWNNRCLPSYYFYTEQWIKTHGDINMNMVQRALCSNQDVNYQNMIQESLFYGDYKWHITINFPPRYWQAVREKTLYLVPRHSNEQDYFPELLDGKHYVTFSDTFEDISQVFDISEEKYEYIAENAYQQYKKWIVGDFGLRNKVSSNLLRYVLSCINAGQRVNENEI